MTKIPKEPKAPKVKKAFKAPNELKNVLEATGDAEDTTMIESPLPANGSFRVGYSRLPNGNYTIEFTTQGWSHFMKHIEQGIKDECGQESQVDFVDETYKGE